MKNFRDIYVFPLVLWDGVGFVYDSDNNFIFQFMMEDDDKQHLIVDILNGIIEAPKSDITYTHEEGYISADGKDIILIRGWGNLTGSGAHNLPAEVAANIQDTFAEFAVERLNNKS